MSRINDRMQPASPKTRQQESSTKKSLIED